VLRLSLFLRDGRIEGGPELMLVIRQEMHESSCEASCIGPNC
jgi:hypothetical protein